MSDSEGSEDRRNDQQRAQLSYLFSELFMRDEGFGFSADDANNVEMLDLIGNIDLNNEPLVDDPDELVDDNSAAAAAVGENDNDAMAEDANNVGTTTSRPTRQYIERAVERQLRLQEIRDFFGLPRSVRLEEVDVTANVSDTAWLTDPQHAYSHLETGCVHAAIRKATDVTKTKRPELGCGNTCQTPSSVASIRLPAWANVAPKLNQSNTVSTVQTNCLPQQERFAASFPSTNFDRRSFAANKVRMDSTGLFFERGSGVVAGAQGSMPSRIACAQFVATLQRMDSLPFGISSTLQNIVCCSSCFRIDLEQLAQRYRLNTRYEVTRFPGLIFRPGPGPWVFIIFPEKMIGTGFVSWVDANIVWRWLFANVLCEFKDKKDSLQESAAEKKNRMYNSNASFATGLRAMIAETTLRSTWVSECQASQPVSAPNIHRLWKNVLRTLNRRQ